MDNDEPTLIARAQHNPQHFGSKRHRQTLTVAKPLDYNEKMIKITFLQLGG